MAIAGISNNRKVFRMSNSLQGKVALVLGAGDQSHRDVAIAMAEAGANIAISGATAGNLAAEAALHSIANEIWSLGRRSVVVTSDPDPIAPFAEVLGMARAELGSADFVVQCSEA